MITLSQLLQRTRENLLILEEREAKYGGDTPLELLNQISDHQAAIELIEQALSTELTKTGLNELRELLRPLLVASNIEQVDLDKLELETPPLPFEPETILIPAGPFLMGSRPGQGIPVEETDQYEIKLPAYRIGKYPVTNGQYAEFIKRESRREYVPKRAGWFLGEPPSAKLDHPVVGISWHDALAYCGWLSRETGRLYRLPTEAEWEKAARGTDGRFYPWGNEWVAETCNTGSSDTTPVTAYPAGISPYGCYDMAGNVQEWTSTLWGSDEHKNKFSNPYRADDGREDLEADQYLYQVYRVHRGGAFNDAPVWLRCSARGRSDSDHTTEVNWRGFRVVLEI